MTRRGAALIAVLSALALLAAGWAVGRATSPAAPAAPLRQAVVARDAPTVSSLERIAVPALIRPRPAKRPPRRRRPSTAPGRVPAAATPSTPSTPSAPQTPVATPAPQAPVRTSNPVAPRPPTTPTEDFSGTQSKPKQSDTETFNGVGD